MRSWRRHWRRSCQAAISVPRAAPASRPYKRERFSLDRRSRWTRPSSLHCLRRATGCSRVSSEHGCRSHPSSRHPMSPVRSFAGASDEALASRRGFLAYSLSDGSHRVINDLQTTSDRILVASRFACEAREHPPATEASHLRRTLAESARPLFFRGECMNRSIVVVLTAVITLIASSPTVAESNGAAGTRSLQQALMKFVATRAEPEHISAASLSISLKGNPKTIDLAAGTSEIRGRAEKSRRPTCSRSAASRSRSRQSPSCTSRRRGS